MKMSSCSQVPEHLHAVDEHNIQHHPSHCLSHTPQHFHNKVPIIIITKMHFSHARNPRFQQTQKKRVDCNLNRTFPISIPSQHDNVKNGEKKLSLGWGHVEEEEKNSPILPYSSFPIIFPFTVAYLKLRTIEQHLENLDQIRPHPNHSTSVRGSMARANVLQREVITEIFFLFQCYFVQRTLRKREVTLSRINIYIVYIIVSCHTIRIIPNAWEIVQRWSKG